MRAAAAIVIAAAAQHSRPAGDDLFHSGSSAMLTPLGRLLGATGFVGPPGFPAGAVAISIVSGACRTEVFRGA